MIIPKLTLTKSLLFVCICFSTFTALSQVGIGNTNPDPSAMLDITSDSQGILTPRMTTAQRLAISNPANGLLVYDLDERTFYFYEANTTTWVSLNSSQEKRNNFVLVKSEADFPAPVGGVITLQTNTYYEVNGTIVLNNSINLNDAYLSGLDANEDRLLRTSGTLFSGSTGGSIRNITLLGGFAAGSGGGTGFNITGTAAQNLLIQNTIIANMASVGTISGLGLFFSNIVQFSGNTTGITYNNIGKLLLSNQAWFGNNLGTFERLMGTFLAVQKASGFSEVNGSAVGFDVSSNPTVGQGIMLGTVFSGTSTTYVNRYTVGSYPGYNFDNNWGVECPGLPLEIDAVATGNIYYTGSSIVTISNATPIKLPVNTTLVRQFRTRARNSPNENNSIVYIGEKSKVVKVFGSISFTAIAGMRFTFSLYKNGVLVPGTQVVYDVVDTNARQGLSIIGTVDVNPNDYLEVFVERNTSSGLNQFLVTSYNLLVD